MRDDDMYLDADDKGGCVDAGGKSPEKTPRKRISTDQGDDESPKKRRSPKKAAVNIKEEVLAEPDGGLNDDAGVGGSE
jgi:hypothetical protein